MNTKIENESLKEKEMYRNLLASNAELTRQYEDLLKQKESQALEIQSLQENRALLENNTRKSHQDYIKKQRTDIKQLTTSHSLSRQDHMKSVKDAIKQLEENLKVVSALEDCKIIDNTLDKVDIKLEGLDSEIDVHHQRLGEVIRINTQIRVDVDANRINRCGNESSTLSLGQTREN